FEALVACWDLFACVGAGERRFAGIRRLQPLPHGEANASEPGACCADRTGEMNLISGLPRARRWQPSKLNEPAALMAGNDSTRPNRRLWSAGGSMRSETRHGGRGSRMSAPTSPGGALA